MTTDFSSTAKPRLLAIDYGSKRIGLAKSDPFHLFAQSVGTFDEPELFAQLRLLCAEGVGKILVGYPTSGDGSANRMTTVVEQFIARLKTEFPDTPIEPIDEFGSSKKAMQILVQSGVSKKARGQKGRLDKAAAALLLQTYLDTQRR